MLILAAKGTGQHCFCCEESGHLSRNCPNKDKLTCSTCGKKGHLTKNCWDTIGVSDKFRNKQKPADKDDGNKENEDEKKAESSAAPKATTAQFNHSGISEDIADAAFKFLGGSPPQ